MPGLTTNIINLISDNLRDRYRSGFPIIKELIQNADDAGASRVVFGVHEGFATLQHPLLTGPALYLFNDGTFRETDKRAITSFAENSKAGEPGTIGKFGLGMKSAFHLCEAFLYIAWDGSNVHNAIVNPWNSGEDNLHPDWEEVQAADWSALQGVGANVSGNAPRGFLLWVPLRRKQHLRTPDGAETGAIIERFPGDDLGGADLRFLAEDALPSRLAVILPLLLHLEELNYRPLASAGKDLLISISAESRLKRGAGEASSTGVVTERAKPVLKFHGQKREHNGAGSVFERLRGHSAWPKSYFRDAQGFQRLARDKSQAEGSVLIGHEDGVSGGVTLRWAVFLPLDEEAHVFRAAIPASSRHYHVVLHGQFFVDAGRRGIHDFSRLFEPDQTPEQQFDESGLRRRWNRELADGVTLPLLLPVLAEYVKSHRLTDNEIGELTKSIGDAVAGSGGASRPFLSSFRSSICRDVAWVRQINRDGFRWTLVKANGCALRALPAPPASEPERPWRCLPGLATIGSDRVFIDGVAPRIADASCAWDENDLLAVLGQDTEGVLSSGELLDYMGRFLEMAATPYRLTGALQDTLIRLLRTGFRANELPSLRQRAAAVSRVVGFVVPERRLALGTKDAKAKAALPPEIFAALWSCETSVLIVPADLDAAESARAKPSDADVLAWLRAIDQAITALATGDARASQWLAAAAEVLEKGIDTDARERLLRTNRNLRILSAIDARRGAEVAVSPANLLDAMSAGNLLGFAQGTTVLARLGKAPALAMAIPGEMVLVVSSGTVTGLLDDGARLGSASEEATVLRALGVRPKTLGSQVHRLALSRVARDAQGDDIARRGLRYLLHGSEANFQDSETTLWVGRHQQSPAWEKLWRQITGVTGEQAWNVLPRDLVGEIPPAGWAALGIREIEPTQVVQEITRVGVAQVQPEVFDEEERTEILSVIDDREVWRSLPFHTLLAGGTSSLGDDSFLDTGLAIPSELGSGIKIFQVNSNEAVATRQKRWMRLLDRASLASLALAASTPSDHWRLIAGALQSRMGADASIDERMRTVHWLPLRTGGAIAPTDVIDIPELAEHIQRLASEAGYCYAGVADLDAGVLNHEAFETLRSRYFARDENGLTTLSLLMGAAKNYIVGPIADLDNELLDRIIPALRQVRALPAWQIIGEAHRHFTADQLRVQLLGDLRKPIPPETIEAVLQALADRAVKDEGAACAFDVYLAALAANIEDVRAVLPRLRLRSASGNWCRATELCHGAAGVDEGFLLSEEHARILGGAIVEAGDAEADQPPRFSVERVQEAILAAPADLAGYFRSWSSLIRPELVGALLCLFGPRVRELAQRELGTRSVDGIRGQLGWRMPDQIDLERRGWMYGVSAEQALETLLIGVEIVTGDSASVTGITGQGIEAPLARDFDTIIVGEPWWGMTQRGGGKPVLLPLRRITPAEFESDELSDLLLRTAEYVLRKCYNQPNANLDALWKELNRSDQLEIAVARAMILEHLPFYLRQLGAHHHNKGLRSDLDKYDRACQRLKEAEFANPPNRSEIDHLRIEVRGRLDELQQTLETDIPAQEATLHAIRQKLRDYQYDTESIPFEMFQNADDAVVELSQGEGSAAAQLDPPRAIQKFSVASTPVNVRFAHWGRLINARAGGGENPESRDFHRDLQKMLVLSSSDKPVGHDLTGKFGLGFKSVLLACDRPRLLSGQMRAEIVGGVLPKHWDDAQAAANWLGSETEDRSYRGTLTEIEPHQPAVTAQMLERFGDLAGVLCVFGRAIRRVVIHTEQIRRSIEWAPDLLLQGIELGEIDIPDSNQLRSMGLVAFRLNKGCVLFRRDASGFLPLPLNVPSLWVTAPTREDQRFGFAVNASFALDAGRGRLAGDTAQNLELAAALGRELGEHLVQLQQKIVQEPAQWLGKLGLASSASLAQLWASLWGTLAARWLGFNEGAASIGRELGLGALHALSKIPGAVPNGLPPPFDAMLDRAEVGREITKIWSHADVLRLVAQVPSLEGKLALRNCVNTEIAAILRHLDPVVFIGKLDLGSIIGSVGHSECDAGDAQSLEALCARIWDELETKDREQASEAMGRLRFRAMSGSWVESRHLLCAETGDEEEKRLAAFAPDQATVHGSYENAGRLFFRRCRPRFEVTLEDLAAWVLAAETPSRQGAVLRYMRWGERALKLGLLLREQGLAGTWLDGINAQHPGFADWDSTDVDEVLRQLIQTVYFSPPDAGEPPPPEPDQIRGPEAVQRIHTWWRDEGRARYREKYLKQLYPGGLSPDLSRNEQGRFDRDAWMKLFALGVFQSLGRVRDFQNRHFLELLDAKRWWRIIAHVDPRDGAKEWLSILEEFAEGHIDDEEFGFWMDCFPRFFRLARWLDAYVELFESIDRRDPTEMSMLLTPLADAALQGGGIVAPALNRTLRMGRHLVIREMLRLGAIRSPTAFPYAYMPSRAVSQFVTELGLGNDVDTSIGIYQALADAIGEDLATFEGDFDIPLRILASEKNEAWQLLRIDVAMEDNNG